MTTPEPLMTGAEHFREAETFAGLAARQDDDGQHDAASMNLDFAHVHATLALASDARALVAEVAAFREHWVHAFFGTRSGS